MTGDGGTAMIPLPDAIGPDRTAVLAFVSDSGVEGALIDGFSGLLPQPLETRRGGIRTAIAALQRAPSPRVLIVDVSGEEQPLTALGTLSDVVEPQVTVLVVGELSDLNFYRAITRDLGATEYLARPLTRDVVARHFGPFALGQAPAAEAVLGGRLLTVTGVRGGIGASTVAVNLAWHFGVTARRHTVLLDPDVQMGTAAFLLNVQPGNGLSVALETPERIDALFVERSAQPVADRLHVLAAEEKLATMPALAPAATMHLLDSLRRRYNFIVADVPFGPVPLYRDLLDAANQRVFVMEPSLAAVRDTLRLLGLPAAEQQHRKSVIVLNRAGRAGGLNRRQVEDALKMKVDVVIPELPRVVGQAATLGEPAITRGGVFRSAIVDLARQVAFTRLLDSATATASGAVAGEAKSRWWLLRWRR